VLTSLLEIGNDTGESEDNLLEKTFNNPSLGFKCDICESVTKTEKGLKAHKTRKHGGKFDCDLCEKSFDSERELQIHRKCHSFKSRFKNTEYEKQICNKCDFTCKTLETMEVHIGKCCEHFNCGLCDQKFENTHLHTCEIYECGECYTRFK
jgi:hypothetical protein